MNDRSRLPATLNSATGLAGRHRALGGMAAHRERTTYSRKWAFASPASIATKLRAIVQTAAFATPAALLMIALFAGGAVAVAVCLLATVVQMLGLLVERWLFFADAKHTVILYYGRD